MPHGAPGGAPLCEALAELAMTVTMKGAAQAVWAAFLMNVRLSTDSAFESIAIRSPFWSSMAGTITHVTGLFPPLTCRPR